MLREQPYTVRCLIARSRRLSTAMPTVWQAYRDGELDAEQVTVIDRVARRVCQPLTLTAIDEQSVQAAQSRCPKQLARGCCAWWCGWNRSPSSSGTGGRSPNAA